MFAARSDPTRFRRKWPAPRGYMGACSIVERRPTVVVKVLNADLNIAIL